MHAFGQQGIGRLITADINNDGNAEVVYSVKDHWNEIRAYDNSGRYLWSRHLGPGKGELSSTFGNLAAIDLNGDGNKEIVFSTENGWVIVLDHKGKSLWQKKIGMAVTAMTVDEATKTIVVGCASGDLFVVDGTGSTLWQAHVDSAVQQLLIKGTDIFIGTTKGLLYKYSLKGELHVNIEQNQIRNRSY